MNRKKSKTSWLAAGILGSIAIGLGGNFLFRAIRYRPTRKADILLIAIKASGGHMSAAKAIKARMSELGYESDIVYMDDYDPTMLFGPGYDNMMASEYGRILLRLFVSRTWWNTASTLFVVMFAELCKTWLNNGQYKCIVSVQPFTYKMLDYVLSGYENRLPTFIVPTDFEDPCIGCGMWIDGPNVTYLLGTDRLWDQCPAEYNRIKVDGMIIRPEFINDVADKETRRKELGLPQDKKIVLIMFGSVGTTDMADIAMIMRNHSEYHLVFVCGKNQQIKLAIENIKAKFNCEHYTIYGFTNVAHKLMQASDVFIGKPGPGVISEAMCYHLPIIYSEMEIMLQEVYNAQFVNKTGIGRGISDWKKLPTILGELIENIEIYRANYAKVPKNNALNQISDIVKHAIESLPQDFALIPKKDPWFGSNDLFLQAQKTLETKLHELHRKESSL